MEEHVSVHAAAFSLRCCCSGLCGPRLPKFFHVQSDCTGLPISLASCARRDGRLQRDIEGSTTQTWRPPARRVDVHFKPSREFGLFRWFGFSCLNKHDCSNMQLSDETPTAAIQQCMLFGTCVYLNMASSQRKLHTEKNVCSHNIPSFLRVRVFCGICGHRCARPSTHQQK